jgi:hypothetical protein
MTIFPAEAEMTAALSQTEKANLVRLLGKLQDHLQSQNEERVT